MMALQFKVGDDRFGVDVVSVVEVIPNVPLQKIPKAPLYFVGLLNYRGSIVPVIDLSYLINESFVKKCLSSRIIMVKASSTGMVGLLAEGVTETIKINDDEFTDTKIESDLGWLVDKVALDSAGMIQHINPDVIVPEELNRILAKEMKAIQEAGGGVDAH